MMVQTSEVYNVGIEWNDFFMSIIAQSNQDNFPNTELLKIENTSSPNLDEVDLVIYPNLEKISSETNNLFGISKNQSKISQFIYKSLDRINQWLYDDFISQALERYVIYAIENEKWINLKIDQSEFIISFDFVYREFSRFSSTFKIYPETIDKITSGIQFGLLESQWINYEFIDNLINSSITSHDNILLDSLLDLKEIMRITNITNNQKTSRRKELDLFFSNV